MSKKKNEQDTVNTEQEQKTVEAEQEQKEAEAEQACTNEGAENAEPEKESSRDGQINKLEAELSAQKDKYMRLAAEYENYRKRTANEKLSLYDDATAKAVTELLPVADSLQMALVNLKDSDPEILKGIELVATQLAKSFEKLKVEAYGEVGDAFDPKLHNAISKTENEELGENSLAAVFQKGYKIGDKIIRHAMVQVANCD